jgi:hypothetical protein
LDSVVALLEQQVKQLAPDQQQVLSVASCIGNKFDLHRLAVCCGLDEHRMARLVWPLLHLGLLVPLGNAAEVFTLATSSPPKPLTCAVDSLVGEESVKAVPPLLLPSGLPSSGEHGLLETAMSSVQSPSAVQFSSLSAAKSHEHIMFRFLHDGQKLAASNTQ